MIKKTAKFLWSLRQQFAKYFIVGVIGVILDMSSLIFLKEILHLLPFIAVIANQIFILTFVFLANKYWSFKQHSLTHRQLLRFSIVMIFNYSFSVSVMYIFNNRLKFDYRLIRLASIILAVSWNFLLYKYFVYAGAKPKPSTL
ncbi:MAG: GtrA family protein [Patescibacteria group bacterium]|jgi:putative flippase GtrA